jgi:hypothetical protein
MYAMTLKIMTVTHKIDTTEVMIFLVVIMSTTKEKDIAIPIPWRALNLRAFSTGILVHAEDVMMIFFNSLQFLSELS